MAYIDFMSSVHNATKRDYLARVNDSEFPKPLAAELSKKWGFDYWDGDRRICYGGYRYIEGRWAPVADALIKHYELKAGSKILDVGCGKGFLLFEMLKIEPGLQVSGIDISSYALNNAKVEIKDFLQLGNAIALPFDDKSFDLVISLTTLHNLHNYDLERALKEVERVGKKAYICVESYRNEIEKANLLYWQVTCEAFCTPEEWDWWFKLTGYSGDHSFIFFE
ncbi:MAG: class I SAM-dependent methyltransferase [Alphaproteobacteria bacterium]